MEKNIVKNGTKVILFATEDTSVTGGSLVNYERATIKNLMARS